MTSIISMKVIVETDRTTMALISNHLRDLANRLNDDYIWNVIEQIDNQL